VLNGQTHTLKKLAQLRRHFGREKVNRGIQCAAQQHGGKKRTGFPNFKSFLFIMEKRILI